MYRLLIVDDERRVREGLLSHIDWASLGIQPCGAADDGETAPVSYTHLTLPTKA